MSDPVMHMGFQVTPPEPVEARDLTAAVSDALYRVLATTGHWIGPSIEVAQAALTDELLDAVRAALRADTARVPEGLRQVIQRLDEHLQEHYDISPGKDGDYLYGGLVHDIVLAARATSPEGGSDD